MSRLVGWLLAMYRAGTAHVWKTFHFQNFDRSGSFETLTGKHLDFHGAHASRMRETHAKKVFVDHAEEDVLKHMIEGPSNPGRSGDGA